MGDTAVEQVRDIQAQVVHLEERLQQARSSLKLFIICRACSAGTIVSKTCHYLSSL